MKEIELNEELPLLKARATDVEGFILYSAQ
jgi:hypothetical protein